MPEEVEDSMNLASSFGDMPCDVTSSKYRIGLPSFHGGDHDKNSLLRKSRSVSSLSHRIKEWVFMSHWSHTSAEVGDLNTLQSLQHLPSNDRKSSAFLTAVNMQSMILGTSVLGLPFCVKIAGVWALLATVLLGMASAFTSALLDDCQYQLSLSNPGKLKRVHISYVDMSKRCFGRFGTIVIKVLVYLSLMRNVIVLVLLTDLTESVIKACGVQNIPNKDLISLIWMLTTIPLMLIDKVSYLAWVSFIGLKIYLCALVSILVICCINYDRWVVQDIPWKVDMEGIGVALGIIINSYSVHMNLPAVEGSMKNQKQYKTTSHVTFSFNILAKITFASFGYLTYTHSTREEIAQNITSFSPLPIVLQIAMIFFTFFSVPMSSFVAFDLLDNSVHPHFPVLSRSVWKVLSRLICMGFVLLIALLVPHFGLVVSLVGSVRGTAITFVLPTIFYVRLKTHETTKYKQFLSYLTLLCSICAGFFGLFSSVQILLKRGVEEQ